MIQLIVTRISLYQRSYFSPPFLTPETDPWIPFETLPPTLTFTSSTLPLTSAGEALRNIPLSSPPPKKSSKKHVPNVTPLNSMPYIDPLSSCPGTSNSVHPQGNIGPEKTAQSTLLFMPSELTDEEKNSVLSAKTDGVVPTGSAAWGMIGSVLGKMDIGQHEDSYMFCVSLPGVAREDFTCAVASNGHILIRGAGAKIMCKDSMRFEC